MLTPTLHPMSSIIAVEIKGIALNQPIDSAALQFVRDAFRDHLVMVFRNQTLTGADQIRFSRLFGDLDVAPLGPEGRSIVEDHPELLVISNVKENGKAIGGLSNTESVWHTDMSYVQEPPLASALYSREIPTTGGDTGFLNMYAAYETLPATLKQKVAHLRIKHDATHTSAGGLRAGLDYPDDVRTSTGVCHPMVRVHPESGRNALFLGRRAFAYIDQFDLAASEALLDELWAHCEQPQFHWHHQWQVGDLVMWDNRCTMHRRDGFDDSERRLMIRTQIKGAQPVAAA